MKYAEVTKKIWEYEIQKIKDRIEMFGKDAFEKTDLSFLGHKPKVDREWSSVWTVRYNHWCTPVIEIYWPEKDEKNKKINFKIGNPRYTVYFNVWGNYTYFGKCYMEVFPADVKKFIEETLLRNKDLSVKAVWVDADVGWKCEEKITEIFLDSTNEEIENLCPDCKVYCEKRFIDGRCE